MILHKFIYHKLFKTTSSYFKFICTILDIKKLVFLPFMKGTEQFIQKICQQIETAVNRRIKSFKDAIWLSDIFNLKKLPVSASTIARLYGLIATSSKPYQSTLDNLAKFLEYDNWEIYIEDQSKHHFNSNFFLTEQTDGFSQSVLEMALHIKCYDTVKLLLEKYTYFENNPIHFSIANMIGKYVKLHHYDEKLLTVIANTEAGRSLFFECFVDEDNENDNFIKALHTYYLPKMPDVDSSFFVYSYTVSQKIYAGSQDKTYIEKYKELRGIIAIKNFHYHLISRYFECNILIDGVEDKLKNNLENYLNSISDQALSGDKSEWLLARSIRGLLHFGYKKELLHHLKFNEVVNTTMMKKRKSKNSAALYIIQLYWLYSNPQHKLTYQPFHLSVDYLQGNSLERIAIENATARLFSEDGIKLKIEENLKQYCRSTKNKWVLNLITD